MSLSSPYTEELLHALWSVVQANGRWRPFADGAASQTTAAAGRRRARKAAAGGPAAAEGAAADLFCARLPKRHQVSLFCMRFPGGLPNSDRLSYSTCQIGGGVPILHVRRALVSKTAGQHRSHSKLQTEGRMLGVMPWIRLGSTRTWLAALACDGSQVTPDLLHALPGGGLPIGTGCPILRAK
jgi:hypothetical protein